MSKSQITQLRNIMRLPLEKRISAGFAVFTAAAFIGSVFILASHADTFTTGMEAESGTPGGRISLVADEHASGGLYARFEAGTEPSCSQADVQKLVDSVSATKIEANLKELVQDDSKPKPNELVSRYVTKPGNQQKADWIKQQFTGYGLNIVDQQFKDGPVTLDNVVGRLEGASSASLYGMGAHLDTINDDKINDPAPGADDNGSGVVATMEAARVMKDFQHCMKTSIDFVALNDEEPYGETDGITGSKGVEAYIASVGSKEKGFFNMETIGYGPLSECAVNYYNNAAREKFLADKLTETNSKYGINLSMSSATYSANGDQDGSNFWMAQLPALYESECGSGESYPGYHTKAETTDKINYSQIAKLTKAIVAALAELSMQ